MTTPKTPRSQNSDFEAPDPPLTLSGERVYRELLQEYGADAEVSYLARSAALSWQRAEEARALVAAEGLTVIVGKGCFIHPAVKAEYAARSAFLSAIRVLRAPPRRTKVGRPGMGEVMAEGRRTSRWFKPSRTKTEKYISG